MTYPKYQDGFEGSKLDQTKWHSRQVPDDDSQISFSNDAYNGKKSITIHVRDGDGGVSCDKCQRAEIRARGPLRPLHGDEFWHGFSFKVTGDIPNSGSIRTVIGQWKAPGDNSPFLAQRFDNGVFHVTVQDGPNRRVVASAEGDPDRLDAFQDLVAEMSQKTPELLHSSRAVAQLKRWNQGLKKTRYEYDEEFAKSLVQTASQLVKAETQEPQSLFDEFGFIQDIEKYGTKANLECRHLGAKLLPDPNKDWVRMAYRIKAGRDDNNPEVAPKRHGEVDVFANGELIAEVRGNIGYQVLTAPQDPSIYFKFGIYRDVLPGQMNFHFDAFAQGSSLSDVS